MKHLGILLACSLLMGVVYAYSESDSDSDYDNEYVSGKKEKEDNRFPIGCRDIGYKHDLKVLTLQPNPEGTEQQTMYFLFNQTGGSVNLYQMRDSESIYHIYLNTVINPKQWAVLGTSEAQSRFICTVPDKKSSYGKIVDCSNMLKVCQYNNVIYGLNNRGNFWIVRNSSRNGAVRAVVHYGIIPAS